MYITQQECSQLAHVCSLSNCWSTKLFNHNFFAMTSTALNESCHGKVLYLKPKILDIGHNGIWAKSVKITRLVTAVIKINSTLYCITTKYFLQATGIFIGAKKNSMITIMSNVQNRAPIVKNSFRLKPTLLYSFEKIFTP